MSPNHISPPVDEVVSFINRYDHKILKQLKEKDNKYSAILYLGKKLGGEENTDELKVRLEICLIALEKVSKICQEVLPKLRHKVLSINRLNLFAQIIIIISSASLLKIINGDYEILKIAVAILILTSSILTTVIQNRINSIFPNSNNIYATYDFITSKLITSQKLERELQIANQLNYNHFSVYELITSANELCSEFNREFYKLNLNYKFIDFSNK